MSYGTVWAIAHAEGIELADGYAAREHCGISPGTRALIIEALRTHASARDVARAVGHVSHVTVWAVAKAEGIALRGRAGRKRRDIAI